METSPHLRSSGEAVQILPWNDYKTICLTLSVCCDDGVPRSRPCFEVELYRLDQSRSPAFRSFHFSLDPLDQSDPSTDRVESDSSNSWFREKQ